MSTWHQCPYCHTRYRYKDLVRMKGKIYFCEHCHQRCGIRKRYRSIPVIIACVLMIAVNLIVFLTLPALRKETFLVLVTADAAVILSALLTAPLCTRLFGLPRRQR